MKLKKLWVLIPLCCFLVGGMVVGCGGSKEGPSNDPKTKDLKKKSGDPDEVGKGGK